MAEPGEERAAAGPTSRRELRERDLRARRRAPQNRRRRRAAHPALAALLVALLALAGLGAGGAAAAALRTGPAFEPGPPAQLLRAHPAAPAPLEAPLRTCSIAAQAADPAALELHGLVVDAASDEIRFERGADAPVPTASVMKLVTAVTATHVLGPDTRFTTSVVPGVVPGTVVVVGGGDPTLRSGDASYYGPAAAGLDDLAAQLGERPAAIGVDASLFGGPGWQPSWHDVDRRDGYIAPISALMVDAGRADAAAIYSERTTEPAAQAGQAFAQRLGARFEPGLAALPGAAPLAVVESPTVAELVAVMLLDSDNVIAEALARHVALALGTGDDFAAVDAAQRQALDELGIPTEGFVGADGSGLSADDRATARLVVELLDVLHERPELAPLREDLPENQRTGTLDTRLPGLPAGAVEAKTGWIDDVFGLAGWLASADGAELRFALFVVRPAGSTAEVGLANRDALDAVVAAMHACGAGLSNG